MARHADKAIIVNLSALRAKYGAAGLASIRAALARMADADRARGLSTRLVAVDRAVTMDSVHGPTVRDPADAPTVKAAVDAAAAAVTAHYLLLLGAPDVLPQQQLRNPTGDEDPSVPSDLPYACALPASDDAGDFVGPTRVVGRLPDLVGGTDPAYLVGLLDAAAGWAPHTRAAQAKGFSLSTDSWKVSTRMSVQALGGDPATLHLSPVEGPAFTAALLRARTHLVNCHGGDTDPRWYGERRGTATLPVALEPSALAGRVSAGTVVAAECCYGAQHYPPALAAGVLSMALTYLQQGAAGVVGSSTLSYGPVDDMGSADLLCRYVLTAVLDGASLGRALLVARQRFAQEHGELDPVDLKTLAQFDLLGDPSVTPVQLPVPRSAPIALRATSAGAGLRRQALAQVGAGLARAIPRTAPDPVRRSDRRVDALARAAGVTPPRAGAVRSYRTSAAVPSRATFHLLESADRRRLTVLREEPGTPPTARTVVRK
jgi:hypothetical protein